MYGSTISQTFTANAGDKISGWAFFNVQSGSAQVQITESGYKGIFKTSITSPKWTSWEYRFKKKGKYTIKALLSLKKGVKFKKGSGMGLDGLVLGSGNRLPTADAGPDQKVECAGPAGTKVTLDGSGSSDPDKDYLRYTWNGSFGTVTGASPTVALSHGAHAIKLTVDDGKGGKDSDKVTITIMDTTPPKISVSVDPDELWPANHKMKTITATVTVTDICDPSPGVVLTTIESDEPDGDSDAIQADSGTDDREFLLRAERSGNGDGRVYTITYTAQDVSGNSNSASSTVTVPHDKGQGKAKGRAKVALTPDTYSLQQNHPNPFNPETMIEYALPAETHIRLVVYNQMGQIVRTLVDGHRSEGSYAIVWDGTDDSGEDLASGIYLYRIEADGFVQTRKMTLMR